MARHRFALVFLVVLSLWTSPVSAVEPYLQFVEGLRQREYFDTAMEYLEWAETQPDLPNDVKQVIPFEKAVTLIQQSKELRNPDQASAVLTRAQAFLEQFLKANPDHPKAAQANSEAAHVFLNKGKVAIIQSRSPSNGNKKTELLNQAKDNLDKAGKLFQDAAVKYDKEWQSYGAFVDATKDSEKAAAKEKAEQMKIRAELDAGIVKYEEAQIYPKDDPKFKATLKEAFDKFDLIFQKHRTQRAGLFARTYQGKCFEEMGDLQKALGLYKDLLSHKSDDDPLLKSLQAQVTHFKLICLNSDKRADHVLVNTEAEAWIKDNPRLLRTTYGIGIRFEKARALEALGKSRELKEDERDRMLKEALADARIVNRGGLQFRDPSQAMITRLMAALKQDGTDPKDFDTAYGLAKALVDKIKEMKDTIDGAKDPAEAKQLQTAFEGHLKESSRLLNMALELRKSDTKLKDLNYVRFFLSYVYYLQRRSYDAAVMGEFLGRRYADDKDEDLGSLPVDAAYIAMAAYVQAYDRPGNTDKDTDIRKVIELSELIVAKWPGTPKATDALVLLGKTYIRLKDFVKAAEILAKVPPESSEYLRVQLILGQALWEATNEGLNKPEAERPPAAKLAEYQTKAQDVLKKAIATMEPKLAENESLPDDLALAKFALVDMANQTGQYDEAIKMLETDKHSLLAAIAIKEGDQRPRVGVKSPKIAMEVYKQILRAYIGLQNLDKARKAMAELEKIAAGQGQDILPIYIALGRQFKEELDRLGKSNPAQYQTVLKSFESFLDSMLKLKDGQNYSSLAWIGAMFVSLGEAMSDKTAAEKYFAQGSTAYSDLIDKAANDPMFCTKQQLLAAKAQLVACKRKSGDFSAAADLLKEVLAERPSAIDTQTEACNLYQDWAASGPTDAAKKWKVAIDGDSKKIWGWATLSSKLMQSREVAKFKDQLLDAMYNTAQCRLRAAETLSGAKRAEGLTWASNDVQRAAFRVSLDEKQYERFNSLYHDIVASMDEKTRQGKSADLSRNAPPPDENASATKTTTSKKKTVAKGKKGPAKNSAAAKKPESSGAMTYVIVGLVVVFGVGGAGWYVMKNRGQPKRRTIESPSLEDVDLGGLGASKKTSAAPAASATAGTKARPPSRPKA